MKLTAEQLHERGPPLTAAQRQTFQKEANTLTLAGLFTMAVTTIDACLIDHPLTRSEIIAHATGEATGLFMIAGMAAEYAHAAISESAVLSELRDTLYTNSKKFALAAAAVLGIAAANGFVEQGRHDSDALARSAEAQSLPRLDCDARLYGEGTPTTPRHFADGRETFVFQGKLVDCSTPAPKGFRELTSPLPALGLVPKPSTY